MDWQIKPLSKVSSITEQPFEVGERIFCFLFKDDEGQIQRADVKVSEEENFPRPESILGRWGRVVKDQKDEEREARQQVLNSSEELFLSLFAADVEDAEEASSEVSEDKDAFKQVLALMLERKRILKPIPGAEAGFQRYRLRKSDKEFNVSMAELKPEQLINIQASLSELVL